MASIVLIALTLAGCKSTEDKISAACAGAPNGTITVDGITVTCNGQDTTSSQQQGTTTDQTPAGSKTEAIGSADGIVELKYDETGGTNLTSGQSKLIALYLRLKAPISQGALEGAVAKIQQEAATTKAATFEGTTLTLDQRQAWLVWCSNASQVDPPADVSLVHEVTLLDPKTVGRTWIQVPFANGVPLRSDDTWTGCSEKFWAVAVH